MTLRTLMLDVRFRMSDIYVTHIIRMQVIEKQYLEFFTEISYELINHDL